MTTVLIGETYLTLWEVTPFTVPSVRERSDFACRYPRLDSSRKWGSFWDKVEASGDGCWPWLGAHFDTGYGAVAINGKTRKAHRVAFELVYGRPADRVLHTCDNRTCVNPAHLRSGSMADNSRDMAAKGRQRTGLSLSDENVRAIRALRAQGWTLRRLGERFGVSWVAIHHIVTGKRHARVGVREEVA